jgi:hypothetical protein
VDVIPSDGVKLALQSHIFNDARDL